MNALHLCAHDSGGAGKAAYRMHSNFLENGHQSALLVLHKSSPNLEIIEYKPKIYEALYLRIQRFLRRRAKSSKYLFFSTGESFLFPNASSIARHVSFKPDLILVYWATEFVSSKSLYGLFKKTNAGIAFVFTDFAAMTGGCHYPWECSGYMKGCGKCPALDSSKSNDLSAKVMRQKNKYLSQINKLAAVVSSRYVEDKVRESVIFRNAVIQKLYLGLDKSVYSFKSKEQARSELNIDESKFVILIGATDYSDPRKGLKYSVEALSKFAAIVDRPEDIIVLTVGQSIPKLKEKTNFEALNLGFLDSEAELALVYQAANLFLSTSVEEAGPQMVNQSIMCGTPVVSFRMGVALDLVHDGLTGYKSDLSDTDSLSKNILKIYEMTPVERKKLYKNARALGLDLLDVKGEQLAFDELLSKLNS